MKESQKYAILLWPLAVLFFLRVVGHVVVVFFNPSFLPPQEYWLSGLIPYQYLLIAQVIIIGSIAKILLDFTRGKGKTLETNRFYSSFCFYFAIIYFFIMLIRFLIFGISIPVVFHWVLAFFVFLFSMYHRRYAHH